MTFDLVDTVTDPLDRRLGAPDAEPLSPVPESPADQAVFDAEFVAMMLVEFPTEEPSTTSMTTPPAATSRSRRPRRPLRSDAPGASVTIPATKARGVRRRTDPRNRSPPH